jgi:6-phosphofructokinase
MRSRSDQNDDRRRRGLPGTTGPPRRRSGALKEAQIVLEEDSDTQTLTHSTRSSSSTSSSDPYAQIYPYEAVQAVLDDLRRLGFMGAKRLVKEYPLETIAEVVTEVQKAMEAGNVENPGGPLREGEPD